MFLDVLTGYYNNGITETMGTLKSKFNGKYKEEAIQPYKTRIHGIRLVAGLVFNI